MYSLVLDDWAFFFFPAFTAWIKNVKLIVILWGGIAATKVIGRWHCQFFFFGWRWARSTDLLARYASSEIRNLTLDLRRSWNEPALGIKLA